MSNSQLSARISKFMDSKRSLIDLSLTAEPRKPRTHRTSTDVSDTQFIALAIQ